MIALVCQPHTFQVMYHVNCILHWVLQLPIPHILSNCLVLCSSHNASGQMFPKTNGVRHNNNKKKKKKSNVVYLSSWLWTPILEVYFSILQFFLVLSSPFSDHPQGCEHLAGLLHLSGGLTESW